MKAVKKGRPATSVRSIGNTRNNKSNNNNNNVKQPTDSSQIAVVSSSSSCDSSNDNDNGSPRRRLELEDEGSQSVSFDPSNISAINSSGVIGEVRYDSSDHTINIPRGSPSSHMIILPRALLSCSNNNNNKQEQQQIQYTIRDDDVIDSSRSPSAALAGAFGVSPDTSAIRAPPISSNLTNPVLSSSSSSSSLLPGCAFVRLPHPRHGEPTLFLCPPVIEITENNNNNNYNNNTISEVLYEVQAQTPPGGFGQTWFIDEMVEPNEELLIITPFDITFFALRQVAMHPMQDKFVSAEDLIMGGACNNNNNNTGNSIRGTDWPGWAVAIAQCPALTPAVMAMQSHTVLDRICESKSIGGDYYYRFNAEKMGEWLRAKVKRVTQCPALINMLQLGNNTTNNTNTTTSGKKIEEDNENKIPVVPISVAFGVVAEYIVDKLINTATELCGAGDNNSNNSNNS